MTTQSESSSGQCIESSTRCWLTTQSLRNGALLLFLTLCVVSCATVPTTVERVTYVHPPAALLQPTPPPGQDLSEVESNEDLLKYCLDAKAALQMCNADKSRVLTFPQDKGD